MSGSAIRFTLVAVMAGCGLGACAQLGAGSGPTLAAADLQPYDAADGGGDAAQAAPAERKISLFRHASFLHLAPKAEFSSRSSISDLCAHPEAKAVLDRDLPGLTTRPEFDMFKHMSLRTLRTMSGGKMTKADVKKVDADLAKIETEPVETQRASLAP